MSAQTIIIFIVLQFLNVVLSTLRSVLTVKGSKLVASIASAVAYGVYSILTVVMVKSVDLWLVVVVTVVTNLVGTYLSKWLLEKFHKDDVWEIVATVETKYANVIHNYFKDAYIDHYFVNLDNGKTIYHIYSKSQDNSTYIKTIIDRFDGTTVAHTIDVRL